MQFIVIGRDGTDDGALQRRLDTRSAHLAASKDAVASGEQLMAAAMLNDGEQMSGSVLIVDFPNRAALDVWLEKEPYVTGKVWNDVEIIPCKVAPAFQK